MKHRIGAIVAAVLGAGLLSGVVVAEESTRWVTAGASYEELVEQLGQPVLARGEFSIEDPLGPSISLGALRIYIAPSTGETPATWLESFADLHGQRVSAKGVLHFRTFARSSMGRAPGHFYFDAADVYLQRE